jgi:hypothetical protein
MRAVSLAFQETPWRTRPHHCTFQELTLVHSVLPLFNVRQVLSRFAATESSSIFLVKCFLHTRTSFARPLLILYNMTWLFHESGSGKIRASIVKQTHEGLKIV